MSVGTAVEETVVSGGAGAVGLVPGVGEIGAAAIHGIDAAAHGAYGLATGNEEQKHIAMREVGAAGASAIPAAGKVMAGLDIAQAPVNAVSAVGRAFGAEIPTTGEIINNLIWGDHAPGLPARGGGEEHH
jgi:hypothetical protein